MPGFSLGTVPCGVSHLLQEKTKDKYKLSTKAKIDEQKDILLIVFSGEFNIF